MTKKHEDKLQVYATMAFFASLVTGAVSTGMLNTVAITVCLYSFAVMGFIYKYGESE